METSPPVVHGFRPAVPFALPERALQIQLKRAEGHAQVINEGHREVLRALHYSFYLTARGITPGRVAWPLPVGAGKTQSVVSFVAAVAEMRVPLTILVCMNRVEALAKLQRDMIEAGVPPEMIGLLHTHKFDSKHADACRRYSGPKGHASAPSIDEDAVERYPVLLVTHKMLQSRQDIVSLTQMGDSTRSLVIWDESLLKSHGRALDLVLVREAREVAKLRLRDMPRTRESAELRATAHAALAYMDLCLSLLDEELTRQAEGIVPMLVTCPEKTADEINSYELAIEELLASGPRRHRRAALASCAEAFLRNVRQPVRAVQVVEHGHTRGLIEFRLLIPESLKRIVILDASHVVRKLISELDSSIVTAEVPHQVKSFETLNATQLVSGGGRSTLNHSLAHAETPLSREIAQRVAGYPADEAVLVFTYKADDDEDEKAGKPHASVIKEALRTAGVDTAATLANGRARFAWLTWGCETGISDFAYCSRVLCVGVYRQSKLALSALVAGQVGRLDAPQAGSRETIDRVLLSEVFHALQQAAGRGACRDTFNGQAGRMALDWIGVEDFPRGWWDEALPGCVLSRWEPVEMTARALGSDALDAMREHIHSRPADVDFVSCRSLKLGANLTSMRSDTFSKTRSRLNVPGWSYDVSQRGFVRNPFAEVA